MERPTLEKGDYYRYAALLELYADYLESRIEELEKTVDAVKEFFGDEDETPLMVRWERLDTLLELLEGKEQP